MVQPQQSHRPPLRAVMEAYVNVTATTYAAKAGDRVIGINRAGTVTITLPSSGVRKGRVYTVKDESSAAATNNITVATEGSETIDGSATDTLSTNYEAKTYYSDGSNWFTVPLLAVGSHSLASHSSEAHSELSGVGTDDHHAQAHQVDHNSGGADALKLDDLAAPNDNTDLDFSTTAHGLAPKGTNVGNFLKDDETWAAPSGGPSQATQAAIEAETNENTYAPPDLIVHSPGISKVWVRIESAGTIASPDFNVSTITNTGTGDRTINFTTAFSSSIYAAVTGPGSDQDDTQDEGLTTFAVGSVKTTAWGSAALQDHPIAQ